MQEEGSVGLFDAVMTLLQGVQWLAQNIVMSFYNFGYAVLHPQLWLDWSDKQAVMRFVYYGGSVEFFFVIFTTFLIVTGVGFWRNSFMWLCVRVLEGFANGVGRFFAWAGLLMVLQQVVILASVCTKCTTVVHVALPEGFCSRWLFWFLCAESVQLSSISNGQVLLRC